jgi:tetratricopeptide (TPR) repeat protein
MARVWLAALLALCVPILHAEDAASEYYASIQDEGVTTPPDKFLELEADSYRRFGEPAAYPGLVRAFAATSERTWAIVYGEVAANLSDDEAVRREMGDLVFASYHDAIEATSSGQMTVSLTRVWKFKAGDSGPALPFEVNFEMSAILGLVTSGFEPGDELTIQALAKARERQVALWREKGLPETELLRWHERILQAGHFEAYHYWLLGASRPGELESYRKAHRAAYDEWTAWRSANRLRLHVPDFHRLLLASEDPELELLMAGRTLLEARNPAEALRKSFDVVARRLDARHAGAGGRLYCARSQAEAVYYMAMAAAADEEGKVLGSTWSDAHFLRGYALLELQRLDESREALERAVSLSPANAQYLSELAYTYQAGKDWAGSLARYVEAEEAAALSPDPEKAGDTARALRGQGYALVELGLLDDAEAKYRKAMEVDPSDRMSAGEIEYIRQVRAKSR